MNITEEQMTTYEKLQSNVAKFAVNQRGLLRTGRNNLKKKTTESRQIYQVLERSGTMGLVKKHMERQCFG